MKSLYLIFAVCALTAYGVVSSGSPCLNKEVAQVDTRFYAFYDALENGNIDRALELMTSPRDVEDVIASIETLRHEAIDRSSMLWSAHLEELCQFARVDMASCLVAREYAYSTSMEATAEHLKLLLRGIGLLESMETLTEACVILSENNTEVDAGIKRAINTLSATAVCQRREFRFEKGCGTHWHSGPKKCYLGKQLQIGLLAPAVYASAPTSTYKKAVKLFICTGIVYFIWTQYKARRGFFANIGR